MMTPISWEPGLVLWLLKAVNTSHSWEVWGEVERGPAVPAPVSRSFNLSSLKATPMPA